MMSGRYPVNASKEFIVLLKQLKANANVNQIDEPVIVLAMANKATLPYKRDGKRGKRAHVRIEVMDKTKLKIAKK
jgi:ribosomal protein L22